MKWIYKPKIDSTSELLKYGPMYGQLLFSRGVNSITEAENYLNPKLENLPDPALMPGIKKAVKLILSAVKANKTIYIYGDYDVDGICSSSILFDYLYRYKKAKVIPYIPNRFDEGYGLNEQALKTIKEKGADLVITVDCGIRDSKLVKKFVKNGLDFVITDHHAPPEDKFSFPENVPVVHPGIKGSEYPNKSICATNVAWKLICMMDKASPTGIDVNDYLDAVGLATVCDVMPLTEENRIIVKYGLEVLKLGKNPGLFEILIRNGLDLSALDAYHYGFVIGPRLNAAGRMEDALIGLRLLTTKDQKSISLLTDKLEKLNRERQMLTTKYLDEAEIQAKEQIAQGHKLLFIVGDKWSEGIIGLVAGKLTEKYGLPVIASTKLDDGVKGSARSVNGFNITEAISKFSPNLTRFGGHNQAAGFTAITEKLDSFISSLQEFANSEIDLDSIQKILQIDADLDENNLNIEFAKKIFSYKPFGYGNSTPVFKLTNTKIIRPSLIGRESKHLKLYGQTSKGKAFDAIAFNRADLFDKIQKSPNIDLAFNLDVNSWNGQENIQLNIKDIKSVDEKDN